MTTKVAKVPLEVNQPLTGKVKFISYYPEKPSTRVPGKTDAAQWVLTGSFSWIGENEERQAVLDGRVYINEYHLSHSPIQSGLAIANGVWPDKVDEVTGEVIKGGPKYKWTYSEPVRISMRKETGGKRLQVTITRLTELPTPATVVASATLPASPATPAATGRAATVAVPPQTDEWGALERQYKMAFEIATDVWGTENIQASVAAAATIFIEANKRGLTVPVPHVPLTKEERAANVAQAQERFAKDPIDDEDDGEIPF